MTRIKLLSLILLVFILSCDRSNEEKSNIYLLEGVKDYAPMELLEQASYVIYKDENGNQKTFNLTFERREQLKTGGYQVYTTEEIDVKLINSDEEYYMNIHLSSNRVPDVVFEFLVASLYNTANNGLIPSVKIDKDGNPILCEKLDEITLNGKTYTDVYVNLPTLTTAFSHIYYTRELGIAGFTDENGKLWILSRYGW